MPVRRGRQCDKSESSRSHGQLSDNDLMAFFAAATGTKDKELFKIPGATHIQTYYVPEYVDAAVGKLKTFFGRTIGAEAN